jgi:CBS domain-containing protein
MAISQILMSTVRAAMTSPAVSLGPDKTIIEAAKLMNDRDIECIVVTSPEAVLGILTEKDLVRRVILCGLEYDSPIRLAMTSPAFTIRPDALLDEAMCLMVGYSIKRLVVVENNKAIGVITFGDIWRRSHKSPTLPPR